MMLVAIDSPTGLICDSLFPCWLPHRFGNAVLQDGLRKKKHADKEHFFEDCLWQDSTAMAYSISQFDYREKSECSRESIGSSQESNSDN